MSKPLQILFVEDQEDDAILMVHQLRKAAFNFEWIRVDRESDYIAALRPDLDLIISDYNLPQFNGLRALELMKSRCYDMPFIIVSGAMGEEIAVRAMQEGATDYLMKDRTERLASAINQALDHARLRRENKLAEQARREGERKFRLLFDGAQDSIYMLHNGVFTDCNAKGLRMFGRTWDQIVGHTPDEFAPETQPDGRSSREKAFEIVMRAMAGEPQFFEWTSLHANGTPVCSEITLNNVEIQGVNYLMAVARDITDRRKAEELMTEQAALLDQARDAIALRDLKGTIMFWGKGAERIYGWTKEEVAGRNISELIYQDKSKFEEANQVVIETGEWVGEVQQFTKDRREVTVEARWTLLLDKDGHPKSVLAINTDITEKKTMEAQLARAHRLESIGTLAGGIAHDLNNILTPILTSVEILKLMETNPRAKNLLETIETSSKRGADIVRQVLSFARGTKGKRAKIEPKRLLKDIERFIRDTFPRNIQFKLSIPVDCWSILGDATQLHQVLLNLCLNARDAMPKGGTLSIRADKIVLNEQESLKHLGSRPGNYLLLTVSDTGTGIDAAVLDKMFEPFFTTKEVGKGTGLGLSTVVANVKGHDGFLDVRSAPGEGTDFHIYLPAMAAVEAPIKVESVGLSKFARGDGETILVVDDEPAILAVTCDTLEAFGYTILRARDGAEALEIFQKEPDDISVVLTDMTMPNLDGPGLIRALLKLRPSLKIIASSGFMTNENASRATLAKAKYFLPKPYTAEVLLNTVRSILHEENA